MHATCTFGDDLPAVIHVVLSDGCYARPDDRQQLLCPQHRHQGEPIGTWHERPLLPLT